MSSDSGAEAATGRFDVDDVMRVVAELPEDATNPRAGDYPEFYGSAVIGEMCLYTSPDGERHCIVGEIMARLGLEPPDCTVIAPAFRILSDPRYIGVFRSEALALLQKLQHRADSTYAGVPLTWGQAIRRLIAGSPPCGT